MPSIAPELQFDILSRLQPKDLLRYMCVSNPWYDMILDERFIKAHHEFSIKTNSSRAAIIIQRYGGDGSNPTDFFFSLPIPDDDTIERVVKVGNPLRSRYFKIVGHSNGLVCIDCSHDDKHLAVWNPSVQKLQKIPLPTFEQPSSSEFPFETSPNYGFGYDSVNDDYKLVAVECFVNKAGNHAVEPQVNVYSLKTKRWKMVFLNGAVICPMQKFFPGVRYRIKNLDLASEKYHAFSVPFAYEYGSRPVLEVLGGCLCIGIYFVDHHFRDRYTIWIMKEYGVSESWNLLCSITSQFLTVDEDLKPVVFSKDGEKILLMDDFGRVVRYDLQEKRGKRVEIQGLATCASANLTICYGSLRLLDKSQDSKKRKTRGAAESPQRRENCKRYI